jgi:Fe-S cluster biogenesis protein NfuA
MEKIIDAVRQWFGSSKKHGLEETHAREAALAKGGQGYKSLRIQPTPNPHACQFVVNKMVIDSGTVGFASADEAKGDPFAEAMFKIFGIENVFLKENFITVTKSPVVGWSAVVEPIEGAIEAHLRFYETAPAPAAADDQNPIPREFTREQFSKFSDREKERIVNAVFDYAIRPMLANDGGDLILDSVQGSVVRIRYQGACGSCPSSTRGTLQFIENLLKENLHPDLTVESQ